MIHYMEIKKAVIPAAGFGTRFLPATKAVPKELIPIVEKPILQLIVEEGIESGIEEFIVVVSREKRPIIEQHFMENKKLYNFLNKKGKKDLLEKLKETDNLAKFVYVEQKEQLGLGHAILQAEKYIKKGEAFAVLLPDDLVMLDSKEPCTKVMIGLYYKHKTPIIGVEPVPREKISKFGIVTGRMLEGHEYLVEGIIEKPKESSSNLAVMGRYILTSDIFDALRNIAFGTGNEIQLSDALRAYLKKNEMYAYKIEGKRFEADNKLSYLKTALTYALDDPEIGDEIREFIEGLR